MIMENKICILIPTRKRLVDFQNFANSWMKTTEGKSVVIVAIDSDDNTYDEIINSNQYPFIYERQESKPFLKILNDMAVRYAEKYTCVAFMEDDCTYNTFGWETAILNKQNEIGKNSIIWCEDLVNHNNIVGLPFMNSHIIRTLGWMACPKFSTLFTDHYWKHLGEKLNSLYYFSNIIIEHRHYSRGKRKSDEISKKVESESVAAKESIYFKSREYQNNLNEDVKKLKEVC
jgi:hypothetical protein